MGVSSGSGAARPRPRPRLAHGVRQRAHVGLRGRLDDVGRDALAGGGLARELEHDARLAERVLAAGDRVDAELAQPRLAPVAALIARKIASTGPSPVKSPTHLLAVRRADRDARVRRAAGEASTSNHSSV